MSVGSLGNAGQSNREIKPGASQQFFATWGPGSENQLSHVDSGGGQGEGSQNQLGIREGSRKLSLAYAGIA